MQRMAQPGPMQEVLELPSKRTARGKGVGERRLDLLAYRLQPLLLLHSGHDC